jgi:hypothetical protein
VLAVKLSWGFAMDASVAPGNEADRIKANVVERCDQLFARLADTEIDTDAVATQLVETLLHGIGTPGTTL